MSKNTDAMSMLTHELEKPSLMAKTKNLKITNWPHGFAYVLWVKLKKKYKPQDLMLTTEKSKQLMNLKLNKNNDQVTLSDRIAQVEISFTGIVNKSLKIAAVVNAAEKYHMGVIHNLTNEKKEKSETVTAEDLIEVMNKKW